MKILHRVSFNDTRNGGKRLRLNELGVPTTFTDLPAPPGVLEPLGMVSAVIQENTQLWEAVEQQLLNWGASDAITTEFTAKEKTAATWLSLEPSWHWDYPMPVAHRAYIDATYDIQNGCLACGAGWVQKAPFRVSGEPKWGRRNIFQLNWVFDEFFVTPELYIQVFQRFGIAAREVIEGTTGAVLTSVVQLVIDDISPMPLVFGVSPKSECCNACGRVRHTPHRRGFFPRLPTALDTPILKTQEHFGSGSSSWRSVMVRHSLYDACTRAGVRGVDFWPSAK